jgi:peptidoglycan/LPS O-acetylase OafA/YrhL
MGFSGVDVFFVISGFILWHTTRDRRGSRAVAAFLMRRFARIFTGYWPFLAIALVLWWWCAPHELATKDWVRSLLLVPMPMDRRVIPVSWTLTYELYFYLIFAALLWFPPHIRFRVLCLLGACVLFVAVAIALHGGAGDSPRVQRWLRPLVSPYLLEFLAGALLCRMREAGIHCGGVWTLIGSAALFALGGWLNLEGGYAFEEGAQVVQRVAIFGPAAAMLVYAGASLEARGYRFWPSASGLLGGASFRRYLEHPLLLAVFVWLGIGRELPLGETWSILARLAITLGYSIWHHRWLETPCYRMVRERLGA